MRCLHILPMNKLSGAEKMALLICKNMKEFEPVVVCGGSNLKSVFEKEGIKSYSLDFSTRRVLKTIYLLKQIIKENDIKILHAHDNIASLNAYLTKKVYGLDVKVVAHIHSCYPFLKKNGINKMVDSFFRPKYDLNILCGSLVDKFYKNNTMYYKTIKSKVLSNAINIDSTIVDLDELGYIRERFNIPDNKIILGFIGRICNIKGIVPFIEEISIQKDKFEDCKILLIGNGEQENKVREFLKKLNLEELFILIGFQQEVHKFYPLIDIFFLPSLYEGLPMVILEAMTFKKAIVSMNVGSISEVIKNNDTGILIEKNAISCFVSELEKLKNNKELQIKLGNNAYEYVNKNFNISSYIEKLQQSYREII